MPARHHDARRHLPETKNHFCSQQDNPIAIHNTPCVLGNKQDRFAEGSAYPAGLIDRKDQASYFSADDFLIVKPETFC
jgi:hypothetical protein